MNEASWGVDLLGWIRRKMRVLIGWIDPEAVWTEAEKKAAQQGYDAYLAGWDRNPYPRGSAQAKAWDDGYKQGPTGEPW